MILKKSEAYYTEKYTIFEKGLAYLRDWCIIINAYLEIINVRSLITINSFFMAISNIWQNFCADFHLNFIKGDKYLQLTKGLGNTLKISFLSIILGVIFGAVAFLLRNAFFLDSSRNKLARGIGKTFKGIGYLYVDVIRATPMVTQLLIIYFVIFASVNIDPVFVAVLAFGFNSGAYVSEIFRAGIQSIDPGQMEAGRSLGLSRVQTMVYIIVPQAIKNILPTLANEFIVLIKETAVVGYISVQDLTRGADIIRSLTFEPFLPLIAAAIIYYVIIKFLTLAIAAFERRLHASDNR